MHVWVYWDRRVRRVATADAAGRPRVPLDFAARLPPGADVGRFLSLLDGLWRMGAGDWHAVDLHPQHPSHLRVMGDGGDPPPPPG